MSTQALAATRAAVADQVKFDPLASSTPNSGDYDKQLKIISRSFISDTLTAPSKEMYLYAIQSTIGDDVYHEPTTVALETHMASLTGKEAAIFMPSGTMSNQIALRTHLKQPPYSVLADFRAHINRYEAGGAAFHSGAATISVIPSNGRHLTRFDIENFVVQGTDVHTAPTQVVALENTLNGQIFPQKDIIEISEYAHSLGIKMHLDGARIWHVAAETGTSLKELCDPFDSASLCFSKGLGAPVGSCLVGPKEFIDRARWFRKLFGGGMRQIGILSAAAAYALTYNFPQLTRVHALTRKLEQGLKEIGAEILVADTCMVFYNPTRLGLTYEEIAERGQSLPDPLTLGGSRLVLHIQTDPEAVESFLTLISDLAKEKQTAGFVPAPFSPQIVGQNNIYRDIYVRRKHKK